jgi:hypothetical protein
MLAQVLLQYMLIVNCFICVCCRIGSRTREPVGVAAPRPILQVRLFTPLCRLTRRLSPRPFRQYCRLSPNLSRPTCLLWSIPSLVTVKELLIPLGRRNKSTQDLYTSIILNNMYISQMCRPRVSCSSWTLLILSQLVCLMLLVEPPSPTLPATFAPCSTAVKRTHLAASTVLPDTSTRSWTVDSTSSAAVDISPKTAVTIALTVT